MPLPDGRPELTAYTIQVHWDADAHVWWAESEDVPGLVAEGETLEAIVQDMRATVPELLRLNLSEVAGPISLNFLADRSEELPVA
jgi:predicted RNase H-like HicB family nuclease